ncbi:hypothetical protein Syun_030402 [Stephania yunnanensis]|uniref:Uncharacterized protein n=1 Tax=Stephania yunnanensis TaxID=152371 RepID=A0AAP0EAF0_9MAGN
MHTSSRKKYFQTTMLLVYGAKCEGSIQSVEVKKQVENGKSLSVCFPFIEFDYVEKTNMQLQRFTCLESQIPKKFANYRGSAFSGVCNEARSTECSAGSFKYPSIWTAFGKISYGFLIALSNAPLHLSTSKVLLKKVICMGSVQRNACKGRCLTATVLMHLQYLSNFQQSVLP